MRNRRITCFIALLTLAMSTFAHRSYAQFNCPGCVMLTLPSSGGDVDGLPATSDPYVVWQWTGTLDVDHGDCDPDGEGCKSVDKCNIGGKLKLVQQFANYQEVLQYDIGGNGVWQDVPPNPEDAPTFTFDIDTDLDCGSSRTIRVRRASDQQIVAAQRIECSLCTQPPL